MKKRLAGLVLLVCVFTLLGVACGSTQSTEADDFAVDTPAAEILAAVKASDWVVIEDSRVSSGEARMHAFYDACMRGEVGKVKIATYYTLDADRVSAELYAQEKDSYPRIFLTELTFDGTEYHVSTRYSIEAEPETVATYPNLVRMQGEAPTADALYDRYDRYVLADNAALTMAEIERAMFSSVAPLGEHKIGRWHMVYTNLIGN